MRGSCCIASGRMAPGRSTRFNQIARGRFSFNYAAHRERGRGLLRLGDVRRHRVLHAAAPRREGERERGEITVFDTTSGHVPITLQGHHVVVSAVDANARRTVVEVYELSNDSSVTRVAAGDKPEHATFRARLTPGATDFRVTRG